ncbi:CLUMA_CG020186, isoform A [Clunio marinus]|uniref:CLUMA_CG020186, isoform A n=1 Tax=Clunio marinus TaxID=568069 RepID=A0A1J1J472_9DIPT|nr:CLUMA_CG020186, isoform A [Clunio marinus]
MTEIEIKERKKKLCTIDSTFVDKICRHRYHESIKRYDKQLRSEIGVLENIQKTAFEQVRLHRLFAVTTLWPPLHTRKEIEYTINSLHKVNSFIAHKVDMILNND